MFTVTKGTREEVEATEKSLIAAGYSMASPAIPAEKFAPKQYRLLETSVTRFGLQFILYYRDEQS